MLYTPQEIIFLLPELPLKKLNKSIKVINKNKCFEIKKTLSFVVFF